MRCISLFAFVFLLGSTLAGQSRKEITIDEFPGTHWIEDDARWIICTAEVKAFARLTNDEERQMLVEQFWRRRDPSPDTHLNEFRDEHYRRMTFANQHFRGEVPGRTSDRGRFYIAYGPPDGIEATATGETWRYRYIEGAGEQVELEFVGSARVISAPSLQKYPLFRTVSCPRFSEYLDSKTNKGPIVVVAAGKPPVSKMRDLEEVVSSKIRYHRIPFTLDIAYTPLTPATGIARVTVRIQETFPTTNGDHHSLGKVRLFARVVSLTGRVVHIAEEESAPDSSPEEPATRILKFSLPLFLGRYRLDVAVQDPDADLISTRSTLLHVPATR